MNLINLIDLCKVYDLPDPLSGISLPAPLDADACRSAILIRCGMLEPIYYEPEVFTQILASWFEMRDWNFKHLLAIVQAEYSPIENTDRYSEHTVAREGGDTTTHSGTDTTTNSGTDRNVSSGQDVIAATGTDSTAATGTDSTAATGTDTETRTPNTTETRTDEISAENAATYQADSKHTTTENGTETTAMQHGKTDTTTYGKTDTTTYGKTDAFTHGKIEAVQHGHVEANEYDGSEMYTEHTHGNIGVTSNVTLITEELDLIRRFNVYEWIAERIEEDFFVQVY